MHRNSTHSRRATSGAPASPQPALDPITRAVLNLPPRQREAATIILTDFLPECGGHPLRDGRTGYERCAGYWIPWGTITRAVADRVFPMVVGLFGLRSLAQSTMKRLGFPVRSVKHGRRRGRHFAVDALQQHRIRRVRAELHYLGHVTPQRDRQTLMTSGSGPAQELPLHRRCGREWVRCPSHDDNDPSALVNTSGHVYCFACRRIVGVGKVTGGIVRFHHVNDATPQKAPSNPEETHGQHNPIGSVSTSSTVGQPGPHLLGGVVTARRFGGDIGGPWQRVGLHRARSEARSLRDVYRWHEGRSAGPTATERAAVAFQAWTESGDEDPALFVPDRYVHADHMRPSAWQVMVIGDREFRRPTAWQAMATAWVGVDLDGFADAPDDDDGLRDAAERLSAKLEPCDGLTGELLTTRTSRHGIQFLIRLTAARLFPRGFFAARTTRRLLAALDGECLTAARLAGFVGGHADRSAHAPGRLVRLPGWRIKSGELFRSRLVWCG